MVKVQNSKFFAGVAVAALCWSVLLGVPASAGGSSAPVASPSSETSSRGVWVTQQGRGSHFATLQWSAVAAATEYRIYKTGSIRPRWRLFYFTSPAVTSKLVSDRPGAIAIYRVTAMVNYREVLIGRFTYFPRR